MSRYFYLVLLFASCNNNGKGDLDKARKEILALHANQKTYHVNKDAKNFTDMQSEQFLSISSGMIEQPSRQNSFEMFDQYFKAVEFVKWDDKRPPIIRSSDDASVAYVAVEKLVVLKLPARAGGHVIDTSEFAWLSVYKKYADEWKLDCVTSTNK